MPEVFWDIWGFAFDLWSSWIGWGTWVLLPTLQFALPTNVRWRRNWPSPSPNFFRTVVFFVVKDLLVFASTKNPKVFLCVFWNDKIPSCKFSWWFWSNVHFLSGILQVWSTAMAKLWSLGSVVPVGMPFKIQGFSPVFGAKIPGIFWQKLGELLAAGRSSRLGIALQLVFRLRAQGGLGEVLNFISSWRCQKPVVKNRSHPKNRWFIRLD